MRAPQAPCLRVRDGRVLDALYPVLPQLWDELFGGVRSGFGLDLSALDTDVTLMQVEGHYEDAKSPDPALRHPAQAPYGRTPKSFDPPGASKWP